MIDIRIQEVAAAEVLQLVHPNNWDENLLGDTSSELPPYDVFDATTSISGLRGRMSATLLLHQLTHAPVDRLQPLATFTTGIFAAADHPRVGYIAVEHELVSTDAGFAFEREYFDSVEPAARLPLALGECVVRHGPSLIHVHANTLGRILRPGRSDDPSQFEIARVGINGYAGKKGRDGAYKPALHFLSSAIRVGKVQGGGHFMARVRKSRGTWQKIDSFCAVIGLQSKPHLLELVHYG